MQDNDFNHIRADRDVIGKFVQQLHDLAKGLDGELVLVAIEQNPDQDRAQLRSHRFKVGDPGRMASIAAQEAGKDWTNVYFGGYVVRPGLPGGCRGGQGDVIAVLMLGVDRDADRGLAGVLPLEANLVVQTSHAPTVNRQAFYVFDAQNRPTVEEAHAVGVALRQATGADSGTGDVARVFRLPGTLNWPTPTKIQRGRPSTPQFAFIEKPLDGYTDLSTLAEALGRTCASNCGKRRDDPQEAQVLLDRASARLHKKLQAHDRLGDRSSAAYTAISEAVNEGFADEEICALVAAHPQGVGERYLGPSPAKLLEDIRRIRDKDEKQGKDGDQLQDAARKLGLPHGFSRDHDGDLVRPGKGGRELIKVCSFIDVKARIRNKDATGWGSLVELKDPEGLTKQIVLPWRDLNVSSGERDPVATLRDQGLQLYYPGAAAEVRDYLTRSKPETIARAVERTGWHGEAAFALPNQIIGNSNELLVWAGEPGDATIYETAGSLADWRSQVANLTADHPLLVAALCQSLVGPILPLCHWDGFGLHLFGKSSSGKTTGVEVAASAWGHPERFVKSWRTTVNGLEGTAATHNEILLVMDELKQAAPDDVAHALYMLSQGKGKQRAGRSGQPRSVKTWNVPYLSTGEISTRAYINSGSCGKATAGQEVRCLDIRTSPETGIFKAGGTSEANATLANRLKTAARTCHGTAGPAFLHGLVADKAGAAQSIATWRKEFATHAASRLEGDADGQVRRVIDHIATLYAAGRLACDLKVLPFSAETVRQAATVILEAWIDERGGVAAREASDAIEAVRDFIQINQARFIDADGGRLPPLKPAGYHLLKEDLYAIFPATWRSEVCAGLDARAVADQLHNNGLLIAETSGGKIIKVAKKITIGDTRHRLVCVRAKILQADEDQDHISGDGTLTRYFAEVR